VAVDFAFGAAGTVPFAVDASSFEGPDFDLASDPAAVVGRLAAA